jgi:hypothetical protein
MTAHPAVHEHAPQAEPAAPVQRAYAAPVEVEAGSRPEAEPVAAMITPPAPTYPSAREVSDDIPLIAPPMAVAPLAPPPIVKPAEPAPTFAAAARARPDLPPVTMALPPDSGLELVETRHHPAPAPEPEAVTSGPRRVRPPRPTIADEPLQIVETRKDAPPPA